MLTQQENKVPQNASMFSKKNKGWDYPQRKEQIHEHNGVGIYSGILLNTLIFRRRYLSRAGMDNQVDMGSTIIGLVRPSIFLSHGQS